MTTQFQHKDSGLFAFIRNRIGTARDPTVAICIPAWEAEPFIDRTIRCARTQTHRNVRIIASIDRSADDTERVCRAHAREDGRVDVFVHKERLGWAKNVNFLLDQVSSEFFFLYFHDDLIEPAYVKLLLRALQRRPDAASVHCDMGHFGGSNHMSIGRNYEGSAAQRLINFFYASEKGSPLRSMIRTDMVGSDFRLPTTAEEGFWANQPFLMRLLAAGPALRVPKVLYKRWDQRQGGLTDGWSRFTPDQALAGFKSNTRVCVEILDDIPATEAQRNLMMFGLYIYVMAQVRGAESHFGVNTPIEPANLNPRFLNMRIPNELAELDIATRKWAIQSYERL